MASPQQPLAVALSPEVVLRHSAGVKTGTYFGRHVYGFAAMLFALISFVWHDFGAPWQQVRVFGSIPHREVLVYFVAAIELLAGIAVQWRRTARAGALALAIVFLTFAFLWVPHIIAQPGVYDRYGNFFEQLSIFSGALIVYASSDLNSERTGMFCRLGYILFGLCVISFMLEQAFYIRGTASFVPKWIPPGQMFWAITTTIAFGLAAIALLSGRLALLAAQLTTAMIIGFGLLIWLPAPIADPHKLINWAGNAQNLAIAAAAWIVTDYLTLNRSASKIKSADVQRH